MEKTMEELKVLADKYIRQQERTKEYQRKNPDKVNDKVKKYYKKLKEENADKYKHILDSKKQYYRDVVKPRLLEKKAQKTANLIAV